MTPEKRQNKKLGQVFLKDNNIIRKIIDAAKIVPEDNVVEIGCGHGILSKALAETAHHLTIVELDTYFLEYTKAELNKHGVPEEQVSFHLGDALDCGIEPAPGKPVKLVANIPYQISSDLVSLLAEQRRGLTSATLMVQNEFADKLMAKPGSKLYTSHTVHSTFYFNIKKCFTVSRNCFYPVPRVDSAIIQLTPHETPLFNVDPKLFFSITRAAFWGRRKTLINCLKNSPHTEKYRHDWPELETLPFFKENPALRGETLTHEGFYQLYTQLNRLV
ncbi:MAG: 16S rRNA (adenine(1518)-N(6)/adenine(1519)-N(6))-dimethyltransferase RsmA [bacterium]|nr:16S rRNA (adenine(1518)-N(6)/adenine(1519)-N(6))-dimethyltransferase RsmA [bacterium]